MEIAVIITVNGYKKSYEVDYFDKHSNTHLKHLDETIDNSEGLTVNDLYFKAIIKCLKNIDDLKADLVRIRLAYETAVDQLNGKCNINKRLHSEMINEIEVIINKLLPNVKFKHIKRWKIQYLIENYRN